MNTDELTIMYFSTLSKYDQVIRAIFIVAVVLVRGIGHAQPTNTRLPTCWLATNEGTVWRVHDDGGLVPTLSGSCARGTNLLHLRPAPYDYRSNVFCTIAVGRRETQRVEIYYLENCDDYIRARIENKEVRFYEETTSCRTNR